MEEHMELDDDQPEESPLEQPLQLCYTSSSKAPYIPEQVHPGCIPKKGQEFGSLKDALTFYNNYARAAGFGVRMHSSRKNKNNLVIRKEFVCYKQGDGTPKILGGRKRRRGIVRGNCGAKMVVVKSRKGSHFIISQFVEVHNHELATPRKVHLLRSHRHVSSAKKALTQQLAAANVPTHQQMCILELQAGGIENIGCIEQDLYNSERDLRKMFAGHDGNMLNEYFHSEQEKNPAFTFKIEADADDRITRCFWADANSRRAYQFFGDVIVFDTTYNTNRYGMIFAPILGVNNHGQTTLLACAFLSDEKIESFVWLFEQLLKAMPGGPPKMIITDQDPAMSNAIATALPGTVHRYCIWHIVNKFSEKINVVNYEEHYKEFKACIWNSESPEEFEKSWTEVVEKSKLTGNEWLKTQYGLRKQWIPAYLNQTFSAHMTSSQRAEISHAFFKRYVSKNNSLMDFVTRFIRALKRLRHNELRLDHKDIDEKPELKTLWVIEEQMSDIYTHYMFYKFQAELWDSMAYVITLDFEDEYQCVYNVKKAKDSGSRVRKIVEEKSLDYVSCSCKKFESDGIPCRHMLVYFNRKQILLLPDKYILRRWTKAAKSDKVLDDLGVEVKDVCDTSFVVRHNNLFRLASNVIEAAVVSEETSQVLREGLELVHEKIKLINANKDEGVSTTNVTPIERVFNEPLQVRAKGCGKRLKGGKEKSKENTRRCHGCGLKGQSHDKRNCPKLNDKSSQYENNDYMDGSDED